MGTLKIVSADPDKALSLKVDALRSIFPLKDGDIFSTAKIRKAMQDYTKAYGQYGFIDFTAEPQFDIDDAAKRIDITLRFNEESSITCVVSILSATPRLATKSSAASFFSTRASSSTSAPGKSVSFV